MSTKIKDKGVLEGEIADIINDISTKTMERNDEVKIITKYPPLVKKILKIQDELQEIDDYFNELPNLQSKVDEELSDLLHYIENNSLTPKQSAKMIKLIHKKRLERRSLLNDYEIKKVYNENRNKISIDSQRPFFISAISSRVKDLGNAYKNRRFTEKEILNILKEKED